MKTKILLLSAICVSLLCACQSKITSPEATSISAVYAYNMTTLDNSNSPSGIVAKLNSANLIGCPQDFIDAYNNYISAWAGFANIEKKMYAQNLKKADSDLAEFISEYQKNPSLATVNLKSQWQNLATEIDKASANLAMAFSALKNVGAKYNIAYEKPSSWL